MELYKHQEKLIKQNPDKHLLAHATGTGKTVTAIMLAQQNAKSVLVVCPKAVKDKWFDEIKEWDNGGGVSWEVRTKEEFKKDAPKAEALIFDEVHAAAGMRNARDMSQLHKATVAYVKQYKCPYVYLLTATPYLSTPWNIYAYARILGREWSYKEYKERYFQDIPLGNRVISQPKSGIEKDMATLVNRLGSTVRLDDCVDMPEMVDEVEYYDLTRQQNQAINDLDDVLPITRWSRSHQIMGGTLKSDGYDDDLYFDCQKIDRVLELVREHKKIAVVCRYLNEIKWIEKELEGVKKPVYTLTGQTAHIRGSQCAKIEAEKEAVVLINAACSEGYELPSIHLMVFYSYDFSLKNYIQMKGRIRRINRPAPRAYLSLVIRDSIDEDIYESVAIKKTDFQTAIYKKQEKLV